MSITRHEKGGYFMYSQKLQEVLRIMGIGGNAWQNEELTRPEVAAMLKPKVSARQLQAYLFEHRSKVLARVQEIHQQKNRWSKWHEQAMQVSYCSPSRNSLTS
ncbi:hypothetical protein PQG02_33690 (plasmid) [Nostoc sp. UHCC 0926]|uniref:hypothetical protein n=1 Tax=Nostoc sp. UHCC 0926 TaxID=3025190 RepID=UPI0023619038|nr:hypothetical protein [Nostoc sp. UHCC 0926]WDD36806.1 hypothetical protein PQG02_33690 [Nostoc sp. UHCC 0926]